MRCNSQGHRRLLAGQAVTLLHGKLAMEEMA
jgi:hypothetical protein